MIMAGSNMSALERAKSELVFSDNALEVEQALTSIASASANLELRPSLQDEALFERLVEILAGCGSEKKPPRDLLRSIGNLLSDNEHNRTTFIACSECIRLLVKLLLDYKPLQHDTTIEDLVVKVFFNLCNDSPEVQKLAFVQRVNLAIVHYVWSREWTDADDMLLSISASLLASLYDAGAGTSDTEAFTEAFIGEVLRLPGLAEDPETFLDLLGVVCVLLQEQDFLQSTVRSRQIHWVWHLLELVDKELHTELDEDDEKQYRQYLNAIAQSLADLSSLPAFNDEYSLEDDFINQLCDMCVPSDEAPSSILSGCACLILGNLAIDDTTTTALAAGPIPVEQLLHHLGTSNESVFLNAAAGLLRHLAIPMTNRERLFGSPECLKQVAHLYTDITLEQIQVAGLQLTRQILTGMHERTQRFISHSSSPNLLTFLTLFNQTTSIATKLEVARLIAAILRTLKPVSSDASSLERLVTTPDILSPLVFAIKQQPGPAVTQAQADAWLALNLFARIPRGAGVLAEATSEDNEIVSILRQRLTKAKPTEGAMVNPGGANGDETHTEDTRPEWVKDKERDNTVLLVHDVLKAGGEVSEDVKDKLRALLKESEITVK